MFYINRTEKIPKGSAPKNKNFSVTIFLFFFGRETLIFHYGHKSSIFQKYFRIFKNGHL